MEEDSKTSAQAAVPASSVVSQEAVALRSAEGYETLYRPFAFTFAVQGRFWSARQGKNVWAYLSLNLIHLKSHSCNVLLVTFLKPCIHTKLVQHTRLIDLSWPLRTWRNILLHEASIIEVKCVEDQFLSAYDLPVRLDNPSCCNVQETFPASRLCDLIGILQACEDSSFWFQIRNLDCFMLMLCKKDCQGHCTFLLYFAEQITRSNLSYIDHITAFLSFAVLSWTAVVSHLYTIILPWCWNS